MTPKRTLYFFSIIGLLSLIGCNRPKTNELSDSDRKYLQSIADRDAELVLGKQWDTLAAQYSKDAVRHPPNGSPVKGRDSIRQWFNYLPPIQAFHFHMDELKGDGYYAYMHATYDITLRPPGLNEISDTGKTLIVFRKEADGSWLRVADAWSSNLPPAK